MSRGNGLDDLLKSESLDHIESSLEDRSGIFHKTWRAGQRIGRYRVERLLAGGVIGRAYLVVDKEGRRCVIKTLGAELSRHPKAASRLAKVARAVKDRPHPNLAPILEAGKAGDFLFLRYPYYKSTLSDTLEAASEAEERRNCSPAFTGQVVRSISDALGALGPDFPHWDLSPRNIFVVGQKMVVADAGLMYAVLPALWEESAFRLDPIWCAPELQNGPKADSSADVYALSKIVYALVTGEEPPEQIEKVPEVENYPRRIEDLLRYGAAQDPRERYPDTAAFAEAFEAVLQGGKAPLPLRETPSPPSPKAVIKKVEIPPPPSMPPSMPPEAPQDRVAVAEPAPLVTERFFADLDAKEKTAPKEEELRPEAASVAETRGIVADGLADKIESVAAEPKIHRREPESFDEEIDLPEKNWKNIITIAAASLATIAGILVTLYMIDIRFSEIPKGVAEGREALRIASGREVQPSGEEAGQEAGVPVKDSLTMRDIDEVIDSHVALVTECFALGLKLRPGMRGVARLSFTIQPTGQVSDAVVIASTLNSVASEHCLRGAVLSMKFPAFRRSAMTLSLPFKYE